MANSNSITESNKKIIQSFFLEMWNQNDTALTDKLVAENYTHHKPDGNISQGRDFIKDVMRMAFQQYPDINFSITHILAEGDMVATLLEGQGTDSETGEVTDFKEAFFHRIQDNKIIEGWIIY